LRFYDVAIASLAIDAPIKWTDNILSQHAVRGVVAARRGVARRIPHAALVRLALTRELHVTLGMGVREALDLAGELLSVAEGAALWRGHVRLVCDRAALERSLDLRLRDALESAPAPRRGRPPRARGMGGGGP
jgi:hypothetical protein